jgi:hypothetical protein
MLAAREYEIDSSFGLDLLDLGSGFMKSIAP